MKRLDVGFTSTGRPRPVGLLLLGAGLVAFVAAAGHTLIARDELKALRADKQALERQMSVAPPPSPPTREAVVSRERRDALMAQLTLPWEVLFTALERTRTDAVPILELAPDATSRSVQITALAPSYADALAYVDRLANMEGMAEVLLVTHAPEAGASPGTLRIVIRALWGQS